MHSYKQYGVVQIYKYTQKQKFYEEFDFSIFWKYIILRKDTK